jgi:D-alanine-D-alanine ligase
MNIVVLAGGLSTERDVSISTGTMVCKSLKNKGHNAVLLDAFFGYDNLNNDMDRIFENAKNNVEDNKKISHLAPEIDKLKASRDEGDKSIIGKNVLKICKAADIVFIALHGENGEDGRLQAMFDLMGIKYTGTGYLGSALALNKGLTKQLLDSNNVLTPSGNIIKKHSKDVDQITENFRLPCVIKPCSGGSSIGVSIANTLEELRKAVRSVLEFDSEVIIEEYIKGREFSVGVLDGMVLPVIEIKPKQGFFDYANKYQHGMSEEICPADIDEITTKKMQEITMNVFKILKLEIYSRIDFILDNQGKIYCLEANTLPGMTPMSLLSKEAAVLGISHEDLCEKIINASLSRFEYLA